MPNSARADFDEDIQRAKDILALTATLKRQGKPQRVYRDVRLCAVAMAVGAMDAYFCDKYVDCIARALRAYTNHQWPGTFPARYAKTALPAGEVLKASRTKRPLWGIRMAARSLMEKEHMYSVSRVPDAFNPILPPGEKLWQDIIEVFIKLNRKRLTGINWPSYDGLVGRAKEKARTKATSRLMRRLGTTVQHRHDWIHNCGRPKDAIKDLTEGQARVRINEIQVFVTRIDSHIEKHRIA